MLHRCPIDKSYFLLYGPVGELLTRISLTDETSSTSNDKVPTTIFMFKNQHEIKIQNYLSDDLHHSIRNGIVNLNILMLIKYKLLSCCYFGIRKVSIRLPEKASLIQCSGLSSDQLLIFLDLPKESILVTNERVPSKLPTFN